MAGVLRVEVRLTGVMGRAVAAESGARRADSRARRQAVTEQSMEEAGREGSDPRQPPLTAASPLKAGGIVTINSSIAASARARWLWQFVSG
eukprot:1959174-Rhodomonas_salina.1